MRLIFVVLLMTSFAAHAEALSPEQCVEHYATVYRVPPELIPAFIDVESGWNPHALSDKGAMGLMHASNRSALRSDAAVRCGAEYRGRNSLCDHLDVEVPW